MLHASEAPHLPLHPEARLGTAIHKLLAQARNRRRSRSEISLAFDELVAAEERQMRSSVLESHLVPLSRSVAQYFVRAAQAIQRAVELSERAPARQPYEHTVAQAKEIRERRLGAEIPVSTTDRLVRGTIDLVEYSAGLLHVVEFKTGKLTDEAGTLRSAFRDQANLYAALYEQTFGEFPAKVSVVSISGESIGWPPVAAVCRELLQAVRTELETINRIAKDGPRAIAERTLARPSPRACQNCTYRPACPSYLLDVPRPAPWPADLIGTVREIRMTKDGTLLLDVRVRGLRYAIRTVTASRARHPELHMNCQHVASFNLRRTGGRTTFQEGPLSRFACVSHGPGT